MDYFTYRSSSSSNSSYCNSDHSDIEDNTTSIYTSKSNDDTSSNATQNIAATTTSGANSTSTGSLPSTPTAYPQDIDRSADKNSRPTYIRYSASFFIPETKEPFNLRSLSKSLPSPPTTPQTQEGKQQQQRQPAVTDKEQKKAQAESSTKKPASTGQRQFYRQPSSANFLLLSTSISLPLSLQNTPATIIEKDNTVTIQDEPEQEEDEESLKRRRFSQPPMTTQSPRLHVLLVDDNNINLAILSKLLRTHLSHYIEHIELVKSGIKALEVLKCRPFDLILMDIDMPLMNGVETTKHIRCSFEFDVLPHNRKVPIFAVTTNDSESWRQIYKEIGMNGCISKPISLIELKKSICNAFDLPISLPPYTPQ